ncbi:MAG: bifunctional riboflavin kinase/FAD synthetase [Aquificae bacterium]|nr:bifunctional riboflavin kinase/FAD synthetase [Aquificota bacterium]
MKVLTEADLPLEKETVCTIGNFDGFHRGHSHILEKVRREAEETGRASLVITFEPHPKKLLNPEKAPCRITGLETKIDLLEGQKIDYLYIIKFDREFSRKSPEEFIDFLTDRLRCKKLIVGHDWRFGYGGKGDIQTAKQLGEKAGLEVEVIPPIKLGEERVSSTKIRQLLKEGKVEQVSKYLGRDYCIKGKTAKGDRLGSKIGFPTINIIPPEDLCLRKGVYSGFVQYRDELLPAVINYGNRPTVDGKKEFIEAHIIGKKVQIPVNAPVRIYFKKFLREEKKFSDIDQLKKQIKADIDSAMKLLEVK